MDENLTWLTLEEATRYAKLSPKTLQRWIAQGFLMPGIHYGGTGKLRRFDREMLDVAIRFQDDPEAHQQAIAVKRRALFSRRRA